MQDRYVGDIGDFANHGILRALCGTPEKPVDGLKLGVVEYLNRPTDAELKTSQGNRIEYLKVSTYNNSTYRVCDPGLYDALQKLVGESLVNGTELKIDPSRAKLLLPVDERYHYASLTIGERKDWLEGAIRKIGKNTDLAFVNPDTGVASESQENNLGPAHVSMEELSQVFDEGNSLIIYQHIGQGLQKGETVEDRIKKVSCRLMHKLKPVRHPWAFKWCRAPVRAYFIVARTQEHQAKIEGRLEKFRKREWVKQRHFEEV